MHALLCWRWKARLPQRRQRVWDLVCRLLLHETDQETTQSSWIKRDIPKGRSTCTNEKGPVSYRLLTYFDDATHLSSIVNKEEKKEKVSMCRLQSLIENELKIKSGISVILSLAIAAHRLYASLDLIQTQYRASILCFATDVSKTAFLLTTNASWKSKRLTISSYS